MALGPPKRPCEPDRDGVDLLGPCSLGGPTFARALLGAPFALGRLSSPNLQGCGSESKLLTRDLWAGVLKLLGRMTSSTPGISWLPRLLSPQPAHSWLDLMGTADLMTRRRLLTAALRNSCSSSTPSIEAGCRSLRWHLPPGAEGAPRLPGRLSGAHSCTAGLARTEPVGRKGGYVYHHAT